MQLNEWNHTLIRYYDDSHATYTIQGITSTLYIV